MCETIRYFAQDEYTRVLDKHNALINNLSQGECEKILMNHGADYEQAKNGAYVYLHHNAHIVLSRKGSQDEYEQVLDKFDARQRSSMECIKHLESFGFSYGQAKSAVYNYRVKRGLIRKRGS